MSTRALKKLTLPQGDGLNSAEADDDLSASPSPTNQPSNRFLTLDEDVDAIEQTPGESCISSENNSSSKAKPRKRQKKNKKPKQNPAETDIDAVLKDIESMGPTVPKQHPSSSIANVSRSLDWFDLQDTYLTESELFYVDHRNLSAESELKKRLGSAGISSNASKNRSSRHPLAAGGTSKLVQKRDNWPIFGKSGLSMSLVKPLNGGVNLFSFEHGPAYRTAQFAFQDAVDSMNPDVFVAILQEYPYHMDTLLQLSDVMRINEDFQASRDLIGRAIYGSECAFHPLFNVNRNNCRLDYSQVENRPFFLALFRHMMTVAQRSCPRTALEFAKLLCGLDPVDDPMATLLVFDYFALKSGEYDYLINLFHVLDASRNLSQLPNFAYSIPLALHLKAEEEVDELKATSLHEKANCLIKEAIVKFPTVLNPLLDTLSVEPDKKVSSHHMFSNTELTHDSSGLRVLIAAYVARNSGIWKDNLGWLEENVHAVIDNYTDSDHQKLFEEWKPIRRTRFLGIPKNILRHIFLCDLKSAVSELPPDLRNQPVLQYDPFPPTESKRNYDLPERRQRRMNDSFMNTFFRSMLPNFNPETDLFIDEAEEAGAGAAGGQRDLQENVHQLMTALRDLLGNIQPVEAPREDGGNNNEDEQDDDGEWEVD